MLLDRLPHCDRLHPGTESEITNWSNGRRACRACRRSRRKYGTEATIRELFVVVAHKNCADGPEWYFAGFGDPGTQGKPKFTKDLETAVAFKTRKDAYAFVGAGWRFSKRLEESKAVWRLIPYNFGSYKKE